MAQPSPIRDCDTWSCLLEPVVQQRMAFLTRVQETCSLWTVYMMEQAIAKCFEFGMCERSDTVVIWSVGAPHYRSIGTISAYARHSTGLFRISVS